MNIKIEKLIMKLIFISFILNTQIIMGFASLNDTSETRKRGLEIEINGMLVDHTQSKLGREFYDMFYYMWESPDIDLYYTIFFTEKALPSFGTQITIAVNDDLVFQKFVKPRYEELEENVKLAVNNVFNYLVYYDQIQSELQNEDIEGSGIY